MKKLLILLLAGSLASTAMAQDSAAAEDPEVIREAYGLAIEDFHWVKRPVVVFADSPADPRFREQMEYIEARLPELAERDVVVLTDTDPTQDSAVRQKLRPRGFALVLIGKDGSVYLRKPFPWSVREITRSIDKMPLRQQEIRDRRVPVETSPIEVEP